LRKKIFKKSIGNDIIEMREKNKYQKNKKSQQVKNEGLKFYGR